MKLRMDGQVRVQSALGTEQKNAIAQAQISALQIAGCCYGLQTTVGRLHQDFMNDHEIPRTPLPVPSRFIGSWLVHPPEQQGSATL